MKSPRCLLSAIFLFQLLLPHCGWAAQPEIFAGTVIYTETAGNYTYIQLKRDDREIWLAAAAFEVAVGDQVEYLGGVPMRDFHAPTLDRTFAEILFLSNIRKMVAEKPLEAESVAMPDDDLHRNLNPQHPATAEPATGEVILGKGDLSIAELYEQRAALTGQTVNIRGRVLKVANNIMGKTWLTLTDGSGTKPDNVLRVVTADHAAIGQVLSVRGIVKTDVNLGSGYRYKLLLDEATLDK